MSDKRYFTDWLIGFRDYVYSTPNLAPLRALFSPTDEFGDFDIAFNAHMKSLLQLRLFLDLAWQPLMVRAVDQYVRSRLGIVPQDATEDQIVHADRLAWRGYAFLPPIDADTVAAMRTYFESQPVEVEPQGKRTMVGLDEARSHNLAYYKPGTTIACPHLVTMAADPAVLSVVAHYLGAPPMILNYAAWWSFANPSAPQGSQIFHCDGDDYRFCKLFFYLTDVGADNGPHMFVEGTHNVETVIQARKAWPRGEAAFDDWYRRQYRKSDDEVMQAFRQRPTALTGAAGTRFLVDTSGLHKGLHPEAGDRLVAQVLYGISPALPEEYKRDGWEPRPLGSLPGVRPVGDNRAFAYLNRLYLCA